ncbi:MAG: TonB-dependent siderophore receptor [Rhodovulum sulfidophilum]|uniref:TonB-dependent siderophore receptor n=1 Tax=Rhodovulum sulfidophilum TaxID=35806 RepID=A0A2W5NG36_RHOSU|nr:MAG: TonB-dependent siderophore receptor [Rhodovulum sulfidophilum]
MTYDLNRPGGRRPRAGGFPRLPGALLGGASLLALAGAAAAQSAAEDVATELATITVEGAASATGPVEGFVPEVSATATKTATPILETPQSVTVVGQEQMRVTGANSLTSAVNYATGVTPFGGEDGTGDSLLTRGFRLDPYTGNIFRDGMRWAVNVFDGGQEIYGLERVEVLKGPSSTVYGQSGPAGILNTVSKRPTAEPLREIGLRYGTDDWKELTADFGGAFDDDGIWTWRLTGVARDANSFVDYVPLDRQYIAPAVTWAPDADTSLTLLGMYQHDRTAYVYGLPLAGTILPNPNGKIDRNRFVGEPDYDKYDSTVWSAGYLFSHAFAPNVTLNLNGRYYRSDVDMPSIWSNALEADMATITRAAQDRTDWSEGVTSDNNLVVDWAYGPTEHTSLIGFDMSYGKHSTDRVGRTVGPLNLFDPVYGSPIGEITDAWAEIDRTERYGLYAQDQMTWGNWVLTLGGRQDWVTYSDRDPNTGVVYADNEKTDAFTGRAGLVYLMPNGVAPYLSWGQSFEPVGGVDRLGNRLKPTEGTLYEAGVRWQPVGRDLLLSAAIYQIDQTNVVTTDPVDPSFSMQDGKVRSKGVELSASGALTETLSVIASYAYTDARTIEAGPGGTDGARQGNVPWNTASLWGQYSFAGWGLPELSAGAGVRYIGDSVASWSSWNVPGYTLWDASASYDFGKWSLAVNGTNLFDKDYVNCTYSCFYGEPRRVVVGATVNF